MEDGVTDYSVALRTGTRIDKVFGFQVYPPLVVEEDGRYLALINEEKGTARLQRVGGWPEPPVDPYDEGEDRWAAFTEDERSDIHNALVHAVGGTGTGLGLIEEIRDYWERTDS